MKIIALILVVICLASRIRTSSALIKNRNSNKFKTHIVSKRARSSGDGSGIGFDEAICRDLSLNLKSNDDSDDDNIVRSNMSSSDDSGGKTRKRRIITPNDIDSLFDSTKYDEEYVCDDIECDDNYLKEGDPSYAPPDFVEKDESESSGSANEEMGAMMELNELVKRAQSVERVLAAGPRETSTLDGNRDDDDDDMNIYEEGKMTDNDYFNLGNVLTDKRQTKSLYKTISIVDGTRAAMSSFSAAVAEGDAPLTPRIVKYDPAPSARGDPMSYGAYRRSQVVDEDIKRKQAKKAKKQSGPFSGVRDALNKNKAKDGKDKDKDKDNKGKGSNQSDTDSFYNAIKRLGSGPVPPGSSMTTGTSDAPKNKRPIQPKKGLARRNKKKIITPDDINGLFDVTQEQARQSAKDDEDDEDYDDDDDVSTKLDEVDDEVNFFSGQAEADNSRSPPTFQSGSYNPMILPNEEAPKWLADADKAQKEEAKKRRQLAGRKKKKLTDDWRFWAAIIGAGGFLTAFYNVFQQTGGFGTADGPTDELII